MQCSNTFYFNQGLYVPRSPYRGGWTPSKLRTEVGRALRSTFEDQVDTSGNVAIKISASSVRVNADVVPCFNYRRYFKSGSYRQGAKIFRKDGSSTENYPQQHLEKGRSKNNDTKHFYKQTVRILKRTANAMESDSHHRAVPSYLVESLVYNCPNGLFLPSTWVETGKGIIIHIWKNTQPDSKPSTGRWKEANDFKYLFHKEQGWSRKDARDFAKAAWNYLKLASR